LLDRATNICLAFQKQLRTIGTRRTEASSSARRTSRGSWSTSTATGASASASERHLEKTRSSSPLTRAVRPAEVRRPSWLGDVLPRSARTPGGLGRGCRARTGELHHPGSDAACASLGRLRTGDRGRRGALSRVGSAAQCVAGGQRKQGRPAPAKRRSPLASAPPDVPELATWPWIISLQGRRAPVRPPARTAG
jgi:hypothetical protein